MELLLSTEVYYEAQGVLRLIDVDRGVSTPEDYQFLAFSAYLRQTERVFIEFPGRFQILDCDVCCRVFTVQHVDLHLNLIYSWVTVY